MTPKIRAYCFYAALLHATGWLTSKEIVRDLAALIRRSDRAR